MPAPPPITIRCDCENVARVPYGERWQCERCGRRYDTRQIPAEEYWGLLRDMRMARLRVIGLAVGIFAVFGLLAAFVSPGLFLLAPVVVAGWLLWYMPLWRRRVRRRARTSSTWSLRPE